MLPVLQFTLSAAKHPSQALRAATPAASGREALGVAGEHGRLADVVQAAEAAGAGAGVEQSREFAGSVLSLPMDPFMSEEDAEYVAYSVRIVVDSLA